MSENDYVNHPSHYTQIEGLECIDVTEKFNFCLGNAIKYIWRSAYKGKRIEDLKKAIWYIEREIKTIEQQEHASYISKNRNY